MRGPRPSVCGKLDPERLPAHLAFGAEAPVAKLAEHVAAPVPDAAVIAQAARAGASQPWPGFAFTSLKINNYCFFQLDA